METLFWVLASLVFLIWFIPYVKRRRTERSAVVNATHVWNLLCDLRQKNQHLLPDTKLSLDLRDVFVDSWRESGFPLMEDEVIYKTFNGFSTFHQLVFVAHAFMELGIQPVSGGDWREVRKPGLIFSSEDLIKRHVPEDNFETMRKVCFGEKHLKLTEHGMLDWEGILIASKKIIEPLTNIPFLDCLKEEFSHNISGNINNGLALKYDLKNIDCRHEGNSILKAFMLKLPDRNGGFYISNPITTYEIDKDNTPAVYLYSHDGKIGPYESGEVNDVEFIELSLSLIEGYKVEWDPGEYGSIKND